MQGADVPPMSGTAASVDCILRRLFAVVVEKLLREHLSHELDADVGPWVSSLR